MSQDTPEENKQPTKGFDFASPEAKTKDVSTLTVRHPVKGRLDVKVDIAGRDSELYQREAAKYRKELLQAARNGDGKELTDEDGMHILASFLSKITVGWEGVDWEGEPMECTAENAYKLYKEPAYRWFRDQVDDFATDRRNYLGN